MTVEKEKEISDAFIVIFDMLRIIDSIAIHEVLNHCKLVTCQLLESRVTWSMG